MTAAFPAGLPKPLRGYGITPYDSVMRTPMDGGASRVRLVNTGHACKVELAWALTSAQLEALHAWRTDDIAGGADEFEIQLLGSEGWETVLARFLAPYSAAALAPGLWRVTASLEVRFSEPTIEAYLDAVAPGDLVAYVSPASTAAAGEIGTDVTVDSETVLASVSDGVEPITYAWAKISGDTFTLVNGAAAAAQVFRSTAPSHDMTYEATYRVTATDWVGNSDTADVTVSHAWAVPDDPYFADVALLLLFGGADGSTTITDSSSYGHTVTAVGDARLETDDALFGAASLLLDGSGDYVTIPAHAALTLGAGAFTVEGWVRPRVTSAGTLFARSSASGVAYEHVFGFSNYSLEMYFGVRGTNQGMFKFPLDTPLSNGTWHHLVIQRDGSGAWSAYADGILATTYQIAGLAPSLSFGSVVTGTYTDAIDLGGASLTASVGGCVPGIYHFDGQMGPVRVTKGRARYSGASFTVPSYPFAGH